MFFETHAHYDDPCYNGDREALFASFQENGIEYVVNVGADIPSSEMSVKLAGQYGFIYAAAGVHPHSAGTLDEDGILTIEKLCRMPKTAALGEIGLDYYYDNSPRDTQRYWFKRQLALAARLNLPVIIHSREAASETFNIIENSGIRRGVIHCYSGCAPMALEYTKMGFYIGVGGVITFEKARKLKETVEAVPLGSILLETDSPYLAPVPYRGRRNNSNYLTYIAARVAEIKGIPLADVVSAAFQNALTLYNIEYH